MYRKSEDEMSYHIYADTSDKLRIMILYIHIINTNHIENISPVWLKNNYEEGTIQNAYANKMLGNIWRYEGITDDVPNIKYSQLN